MRSLEEEKADVVTDESGWGGKSCIGNDVNPGALKPDFGEGGVFLQDDANFFYGRWDVGQKGTGGELSLGEVGVVGEFRGDRGAVGEFCGKETERKQRTRRVGDDDGDSNEKAESGVGGEEASRQPGEGRNRYREQEEKESGEGTAEGATFGVDDS